MYLKLASNFRPFNRFLFFLPEENFSDVGGWVGWPGLATPPPPQVTKQWPGPHNTLLLAYLRPNSLLFLSFSL